MTSVVVLLAFCVCLSVRAGQSLAGHTALEEKTGYLERLAELLKLSGLETADTATREIALLGMVSDRIRDEVGVIKRVRAFHVDALSVEGVFQVRVLTDSLSWGLRCHMIGGVADFGRLYLSVLSWEEVEEETHLLVSGET